MKKCFLLLPLLGAALLAMVMCGCRSDGYYQEQAVASARDFLLEETPSMPLMEQEYIKFNSPVILADFL